ncbi:hypothetical protein COCOBI_14-0320 [Coccomyxa sp. Obi]|nr:hypothetical protein COCOBI_14-0320 [Coccomyxa sp. Obi]
MASLPSSCRCDVDDPQSREISRSYKLWMTVVRSSQASSSIRRAMQQQKLSRCSQHPDIGIPLLIAERCCCNNRVI